jgi:recombination protein RecA
VKNKMAPPFMKVEFDLMYGEGISEEGDILDLATTANMVEKSGSWYSYKGERLGQGRDQAKEYLKANPAVKIELRKAILQKNGIGQMLLTHDMGDAVADDASVEMDTPRKSKNTKAAKEKETVAVTKEKLN